MQVATDAGEIDGDIDPEARELAAVADPGEHEQLRRLDRAGADDHLVLRPDLLDDAVDDDSTPTQRPPSNRRRVARAPVRTASSAFRDRPQEGSRRAVTAPVLDVELDERDPVERLTVVILVEWDPGFLRRLDRGRDEGVRLIARHHPQGPTGPVVEGRALVEVLRARKQGEDVVVGPAGVAEIGPGVEVGPIAARVNHPVQCARSPEHFPARQWSSRPAHAACGTVR